MTKTETYDLMLRDVLASELKCWHRLTDEEAQNLIDFIKHTTKPQRKPLPTAQFLEIKARLFAQDVWDGPEWDFALKESIEAAHGIKGDA